MKKPDFEALHKVLLPSFREVIDEFSKSEDNEEVYAVVLDGNDEYGYLILSLNTEKALRKRIDEVYPEYENSDIFGLHGLKYNSGDFTFQDIATESSEFESLRKSYNQYLSCLTEKYLAESSDDTDEYFTCSSDTSEVDALVEQFSDVMARIIKDLKADLNKLDKTSNFIACHAFHDMDEETVERLMRKTVSDVDFDSCIPEVRKNQEFVDSIKALPIKQRINTWLKILSDYRISEFDSISSKFYEWHQPSEVATMLRERRIDAYPDIVNYLDEIIYLEQYRQEYSKEGVSIQKETKKAEISGVLLGGALAYV